MLTALREGKDHVHYSINNSAFPHYSINNFCERIRAITNPSFVVVKTELEEERRKTDELELEELIPASW